MSKVEENLYEDDGMHDATYCHYCDGCGLDVSTFKRWGHPDGWAEVDGSVLCEECIKQDKYQKSVACPVAIQKICQLAQCFGGVCREREIEQITAASLARNREKRYQQRLARTRELLWPNREATS